MESPVLEILKYEPHHQPWFEKLNRTWIERYFWMEPIDFAVLQNPEEHILKDGGSILMATRGNEVVGTVALKYHGPKTMELTKMAVDERFQGKKIGRTLAVSAIGLAKSSGAERVILYSNRKLGPAIELYKKLGFAEVALDGPYKRSDIKMELELNDKIIFRLATPEDLPRIVEIYNSTVAGRMVTADTEPVSVESRLQWFREHKGNRPLWVVTNEQGSFLGWASIQSFVGRPAYKATTEVSIYLDPAFRGKGIGKQVLDLIIEKCPALEINTLLGFIFSHNEPSLKLFRRAGFEEWGRLRDVAKLDGVERSVSILGKRIY
jgi:L-amino acid N-acyltransferase YncA/predicted GNAT family N-acyltransferase